MTELFRLIGKQIWSGASALADTLIAVTMTFLVSYLKTPYWTDLILIVFSFGERPRVNISAEMRCAASSD